MVPPQACVAVEISGSPGAEQRAALERRCSDILGARRCRVLAPGEAGGPACWQVVVTAEGGDTPLEASVVLTDIADAGDTGHAGHAGHAPVRRDVTFRPNDIVAERWATLGLVIAALVTVEEHSAAEEPAPTPWSAAGGGFAPLVDARREALPASGPSFVTEARASAVAEVGLLPQAGFGARVELSGTREHIALLARATVFPSDSRATVGAAGEGGELQLGAAGLGVCGTGARGRWGARACLGGDVARTSARGSGVSETNTASAWWASPWAGVSAELRLFRHLALTADVEGAVVLWRPVFGINGVASKYTAAPVGGTLALGVAVPF